MARLRWVSINLFYENATERFPVEASFGASLSYSETYTWDKLLGLKTLEIVRPPNLTFGGKTYTPGYQLTGVTDMMMAGRNYMPRIPAAMVQETNGKVIFSFPESLDALDALVEAESPTGTPDNAAVNMTWIGTHQTAYDGQDYYYYDTRGVLAWPSGSSFDPVAGALLVGDYQGTSAFVGLSVQAHRSPTAVRASAGWYALTQISQPCYLERFGWYGSSVGSGHYHSFNPPTLIYIDEYVDFIQISTTAEMLVEPYLSLWDPADYRNTYYTAGETAGRCQFYICPPGSDTFSQIPSSALTLVGRHDGGSVYNLDLTGPWNGTATLPSWAKIRVPCGVAPILPGGV